VLVHDPRVLVLPPEFAHLAKVAPDMVSVLREAEAAIVATDWPEFRSFTAQDWQTAFPRGIVLDPNRFLAETIAGLPGIRYFSVGRAA
jgi:hypothetical protein